MPEFRPLFVVGVERSGMGLIAHLVRRWLGEDPAVAQHVDPTTYLAFARDLVAATGGERWSPELPARLARLAEDPVWRERAGELIAPVTASGSGVRLWPYFESGMLLPFWMPLLPGSVTIVAARNPLDASRSFLACRFPEKLARMLQFPAYFSFRWQLAMLELLGPREAPTDEPLVVGFELLLRSPVEQVRRLVRFLEAATGELRGDEAVWTLLEEIDPTRWHHRNEHDFFELGAVTAEQKALCRYLQQRAAGTAEPFAPARFPLPGYAWEYLRNFDIFAEQVIGEAV